MQRGGKTAEAGEHEVLLLAPDANADMRGDGDGDAICLENAGMHVDADKLFQDSMRMRTGDGNKRQAI